MRRRATARRLVHRLFHFWKMDAGQGAGDGIVIRRLRTMTELDGGEHTLLRGFADWQRGPGHNSIITGPDGQTDMIVYHAWDESMSRRQMCVDPVVFAADGTVQSTAPSWRPAAMCW